MCGGGSTVGAIGGGVIGFFVGGPAGAVKGAQLGYGVGQMYDTKQAIEQQAREQNKAIVEQRDLFNKQTAALSIDRMRAEKAADTSIKATREAAMRKDRAGAKRGTLLTGPGGVEDKSLNLGKTMLGQ